MSKFATREDWLIKTAQLESLEVLTIHPRGDLTFDIVAKAMGAQGLLKLRPGFVIREYGSKIFIQRSAAPEAKKAPTP